MNIKHVEELTRELLIEFGEDPDREGLKKTPARFARAMQFLTGGYAKSVPEVINQAIFKTGSTDMVIVRDIEIYSLCEHHLLPFYGRCHIGYIAHGKVLGVSKLARIMEVYARRLQIQERLTEQIATEVKNAVDAVGVGVVMECRHLCMMMRGVEKQNSVMTTSSVLGSFRTDPSTRAEFMNLALRQ
ncbi:MAG: GTP cyclohydrolase I FolE [Kiritimatiellae bacterium]|nr:GTP cyclohydrolase I FolE [Kiritimatiellia bacterium]